MDFFKLFGYKNLTDLKAEAFENNGGREAFVWSGFGSAFVMHFNNILGFSPLVGLGIMILFVMELGTGLGYSLAIKKEGFDLNKFSRAWIKFFVYVVILGVTNIIAVNMEKKAVIGWEFNIYEWIHYTMLHYVLIQFLIGNLKNFKRLGWSEFIPIVNVLEKFLINKSKSIIKDENESEN